MAIFARRHYDAIAQVIGKLHRHGPYQRSTVCQGVLKLIRQRLEDTFEADNPRFDREKFRRSIFGYASVPPSAPVPSAPAWERDAALDESEDA